MLWMLWKACMWGEASDRLLVGHAIAVVVPELIVDIDVRIAALSVAAIERRRMARKRNHA